jgi:heptaprenyl diphosphate synthase
MGGAGVEDPFDAVAADLAAVEEMLRVAIASDPLEVAGPMASLFAAGGKRLRPALVLLSGALGRSDLERLAPAAMAVELTHAATLVHDDVIDRSPTRRGMPTVAAALGDEPAIVIGDFYFAKAYREAARAGDARVVEVLARSVMEICAGEVRQQGIRYRYSTTVDEYMSRIEAKTSALMGASCEIGAMLGGLDKEATASMRRYGRLLGLAFQIADDVLDYTGTEAEVGKPTGHDIEEGFATLPVMLALDDAEAGPKLRALLIEGSRLDRDAARTVVTLVRQSHATGACLARASEIALKARDSLHPIHASRARRLLEALTTYVVTRKL